jgi:hypothetical protein
MIVPEKMSLSDFVSRRLHPVKVTVSLFRHEINAHTKGEVTEINKYLLQSAVSTIELFVEDYEKLISTTAKTAAMAAGDRKFIDDTKPALLQSA